ncbi:MAG: polysaccharide biosynthesis C-terminal domain-containing protein [Lachnospiraceae bacterium]|nr:polysaccharide biosynthesis C-terminal domain-containing protein [Lachnospiraceae bacterium]
MYNRDRLVIILISIMLFRIPISHIIGDNGCGYLSGPLEVFWCLSLLFGAGLTITLRGMMHDRVRRGQYSNAAQIFGLAKKYTFIAAIVLLIICTLSYDLIGTRLLHDTGSRIGFLFVGPAVFLALFINLNIGYLNGTDNNHAALIGEIVYAVAMGLGMILGSIIGTHSGTAISALLKNEEVTAMYGAMGTMAGLCAGELISLIVLMAMTILYQRSFHHLMKSEAGRHREYVSDLSGRFILGVLSDGLQELILHLPVFVSIILYRSVNIRAEGADPAVIGSSVGAFYSKFIVITGILSLLGVSSVQGSLKGIAAAVNDSDTQAASDRISRLFARVSYYSIPAVIFTTMLAPVVVPTIYTGRLTNAVELLSSCTSLVFIYALTYSFMSVLIKLGYNREMLVVSSAALVVSCVLGVFLIGKYEGKFTGPVIAMMVCYGLVMIVCVLILFRNFRMRFRLLQSFVIPLVVAGVIGVLIRLLGNAMYESVGGVITLLVCIIPAWFIYNLACMLLHVVSAGALNKKFLGPMLVRIGQNLGVF